MSATTRMTFGTILGTVQDAATTVATTFQTATTAVGMLHTYVEDAALKQQIRSVAERDSFGVQVAEELSMAEAVRKDEVRKFCNTEARQTDYNTAYERIFAKIEEHTKRNAK